MHPVFADTFYFLAHLNTKDARHRAALEAAGKPRRFVTTEYVLIELGDAFHKPQDRDDYLSIVRVVTTDAAWEIVPSSHALFQRGQEIFRRHRDKKWQLTDCLSFAVMRQRHLREALTGDGQFEQAGFRALLR